MFPIFVQIQKKLDINVFWSRMVLITTIKWIIGALHARENRELGVNPRRTRHCKEESHAEMPLGNWEGM